MAWKGEVISPDYAGFSSVSIRNYRKGLYASVLSAVRAEEERRADVGAAVRTRSQL